MSDKKLNQVPQVQFHKVMEGDTRDIGFSIRGFYFRWLNPRKQEISLDRGWIPLNERALPEGIVAQIKEKRPGFFGDDGMARRQEMTLGFMREQEYQRAREELADANRDMNMRLTSRKSEGVMTSESSMEKTDGFEIFEK